MGGRLRPGTDIPHFIAIKRREIEIPRGIGSMEAWPPSQFALFYCAWRHPRALWGQHMLCDHFLRTTVFGFQAVVVVLLLSLVPVRAETLVFHASASGKQTLDQGEGGGNPFASSLIEILAKRKVTLSELPVALRQLTDAKSKGVQLPDVPTSIVSESWQLVPPRASETRIALVMVVSDYLKSGGAQSLPGARNDAQRVASALTRAGFVTEVALDLDLQSMRKTLSAFATRTAQYDAAVIYTTGHGVEVEGAVFLLPGDYPISERNAALSRRALPLQEISQAVRAKHVSLIFYGGCRDNPLGN
jgi:hypothetical protein